ncbi:MAG: DUF1203 domain-containing protein [Rhizobiaceae bacterium]
MLEPIITGLSETIVEDIRKNGRDANNQTLETVVSDGGGNPCRHCLRMIEKGDQYFVLAHRPFETIQPYAEVGPIFLHVEDCEPFEDGDGLPEAFENKENVLIRGYNSEERIVYGTGEIVPVSELRQRAAKILSRNQVKFVHVRSASNNCYQARIDPQGSA